jgi:hypothetical protein
MVGAVKLDGARPAPLGMLPAVQPPKSSAKPLNTAAVGFGDKLSLSAQAKTALLPRSTSTVSAAVTTPAAKPGTFAPAVQEGKGGFMNSAASALSNYDLGYLGRLGNMVYSGVKGGQLTQPAVGSLWEALKKFDLDGVWNAGKSLGQVSLQFAGKSAIFAGAVSLVANGLHVMNGRMTIPTAGARIVGDTLGGAAGGIGGAIAGGIGLTLLGALGIAGAPLTIGAAIIGMVGYHYADCALRRTGIYNTVVRTVYDTLGAICR